MEAYCFIIDFMRKILEKDCVMKGSMCRFDLMSLV